MNVNSAAHALLGRARRRRLCTLSTASPQTDLEPLKAEPKPPNYWMSSESKAQFLAELSKDLGITKMEDWYVLRSSTIRKRPGGSSFLRQFDWSPIIVLRTFFPEHDWEEWRFAQVPQKFWADPANHRRFLDDVRKREGWTHLEDLYAISAKLLRKHGGGRLLQVHGDSPIAVVKSTYPEHKWLEWRFRATTNHFWILPENRRQFFDHLRDVCGFDTFEKCYDMTEKDIINQGGESILRKYYRGSVARALAEVYPEHNWESWRRIKSTVID